MQIVCGNTAAEINNDSPTPMSIEEYQSRQAERVRKVEAKGRFIKRLLANEPYVIGKNTWVLADAISNIQTDEFWNWKAPSGKSVQETYEDDPDMVAIWFEQGHLNQFRNIVQFEVEKLSDLLDGKL